MPPSIAAALTVTFVALLFFRDSRRSAEVSGALWLPVLWMGITGSRFVSQWLSLGSGDLGAMTEGSPIDAFYFGALILAGLVVLAKRNVVMSALVRNNRWLIAFFLYCLVSILWSDFPFIAFKRWVKTLGHPVMALIILTDPDPARALRTVMKRLAYLLLPLSVIFIKYFPQYGRGWDPFTGQAFNNGVGLTKNGLGYVCMVLGLFLVWNLMTAGKIGEPRERRVEVLLSAGFLAMIAWLLDMADSKTSLVTLLLGAVTIILLRFGVMSRRFIGTTVVVLALLAVGVELAFDASAELIKFLGRNPSLTDRTLVWDDALALQSSFLFGAGFESFWLGERLEILWEKWWWKPNQAHNGYIETYLNLGAIGVMLLLGMLVATFAKIKRQLSTDFDLGCLRLALLFAIVAYNYTEAAFKAVHFVWTVFYIIAIEYQARPQAAEQANRRTLRQERVAANRPRSAWGGGFR